MSNDIEYLLGDFNDFSNRLLELTNAIVERANKDVVIEYLLDAVIDVAREQGGLLERLAPYGIDSANAAIRSYCACKLAKKDEGTD